MATRVVPVRWTVALDAFFDSCPGVYVIEHPVQPFDGVSSFGGLQVLAVQVSVSHIGFICVEPVVGHGVGQVRAQSEIGF